MKPTIGVYIATAGRDSIYRTCQSILAQGLLPGDDVLVVGDGFHEPTAKLIKTLGKPFRYHPILPTRDWGHTQMNYGLANVGGDVLVAQDDDDIFAPRAFDEIRAAALRYPDTPILARVKTPNLGVLWSTPDHRTLLDGHCLILPNKKNMLGRWGLHYAGDQDYMQSSITKYEGVTWLDRVVSLTRPDWKLLAWPAKLTHELETMGDIRNECASFMTRHTAQISDSEQAAFIHEWDESKQWAWLWYKTSDPSAIGFSYMYEDEDGKRWATFGLRESARGQGYGRELVEHACWAAQGELWIEVRNDNVRARKLYDRLGFAPHAEKEHVTTMWQAWPPSFAGPK